MRGEAFNKVVERGPEIDDEGVRLGAWLGVRFAEGIVADGLAVPAFPACLRDCPPDRLVCPEALKALHTTELTLFSNGKPMIRRVEGDSSRCLSFGLFHGLCLGGTFLCSLQRVHFAVFLFPLFLPLPPLLLVFAFVFIVVFIFLLLLTILLDHQPFPFRRHLAVTPASLLLPFALALGLLLFLVVLV